MGVIKRYSADGINFVHLVETRPYDKNFSLHMHNSYELFCFVSGKASYMVEGNIYELSPGSVLVMRNSETHKLIVNSLDRYERFTVNFNPEILCQKGINPSILAPFTDRALGEKNIYLLEDFENCSPLDMFMKMSGELDVLPTEDVLYHNLCSILCSIANLFTHYSDKKVFSEDNNMNRKLLAYINNNITSDISNASICEHLHISPTQLTRRFKRITGTTIYQYIISKRLILARHQILKGKNAMLAAEESGFGDYSCFYRMYKKRFGCAPNDSKKSSVLCAE